MDMTLLPSDSLTAGNDEGSVFTTEVETNVAVQLGGLWGDASLMEVSPFDGENGSEALWLSVLVEEAWDCENSDPVP